MISHRSTALATALLCMATHSLLAGPYQTLNVEVQGVEPFTNQDPWMADVWGYEANGRAYALACQGNALRVVDVTDPTQPFTASFVPSIGTDLKEAKTFGHYAYCVNQNGKLQVIDLAVPTAAVTVGQIGDFAGSHNCFVDERGLLYICGHRNIEGFQVYDLNVNPVSPPMVGVYGNDYCHDITVRNGLLVLCAIADGYFELVDVSNLANIHRISTFTHPGPLGPHSAWLSSDLHWVFTGDEAVGGHLIAWDISNRLAPVPVAEYESGTGQSVHNLLLKGNLLYVSYYAQGVRVLDVSNPPTMFEVGYVDSPLFDDNHCFASQVYRGVWGVYPLTTAGNFYFGNMCGGGLYVARFLGQTTGVSESGTPAAGRTR
ncbi:MAG TPA: choice-of-anchor B family protein, partial [Candidatus Udaeobacter sp.]|nr:choice-of-anchor B family protein [Candidatus Udaeobacter sp.]